MSERAHDVNTIDALLPQTQCTRCGYDGCRPYAEAIALGGVGINRCPPGGATGIQALALLLERDVLPLDPACGTEDDPGVAYVDARECIGCARCLPPCPVDAIVGAHRYLHTVIESTCTGCELCIDACPVDCIEMRPRTSGEAAPTPAQNRSRYEAHVERAQRDSRERAALLAERKRTVRPTAPRSR